MRPGEQHGVDYLFVTAQQFEEWIAAGALLEYAVVYGDYKGIPLSQARLSSALLAPHLMCEGTSSTRRTLTVLVDVLAVRQLPRTPEQRELGLQVTDALSRGTDVILRLDVQGAATVRRLLPDAVSVFLVRHTAAPKRPKNYPVLQTRAGKRHRHHAVSANPQRLLCLALSLKHEQVLPCRSMFTSHAQGRAASLQATLSHAWQRHEVRRAAAGGRDRGAAGAAPG